MSQASSNKKIQAFKKVVWDHYGASARAHLPWRKSITPYKVFVSEIMLQQTQVDRVVPFFKAWMKAFPTIRALASAPQSEVLRLWKGLGYNSRAIRMKRAAQEIVEKHRGVFPKKYEAILALPGVGPYTAGAVCAFAYDEPRAFIETNIRRVYLHHFFEGVAQVHDRELFDLIEKTVDTDRPREWYWALMDYGAHLGATLKREGKKYNPNIGSRHYAKQSKFEGSDRQIRGRILDVLLAHTGKKMPIGKIVKALSDLSEDAERIEAVLSGLERGGFLATREGSVHLV